ncbi:MAG: diguanylate cyclase (GGDEF)-like protein/PAS domain S-box-containing protein [Psychromonas sp.]|jgi:diguanylate cyclase (GGDEF)-like protein/PAS domain S-box-containing protein|uniref:bifunctional diguanylate cyclase/phosphodiesterase n=1 Tax=Psychromonas sp. TaxID=1884585 RepID=UPI0039E2E862
MTGFKFLSDALLPSLILLILYWLGTFSQYLIFHFFAEFFAIIVALNIGIISYFTHPFSKNDYLKFLGLGYFAVGLLDTMHVLTYPGMPFIGFATANTTLTFWVFTRLFESLILLFATFPLFNKSKLLPIVIIYSLIPITITYLSFFNPLPLFSAAEGLSSLKTELEYLVIFILVAVLFVNHKQKRLFYHSVYWKIQLSILLTISAEFFFTLYGDFTDIFNILGHLTKFLSFWFIFSAVIKRTLQQPMEMMKKDLSSYDAIPLPVMIIANNGRVRQLNKVAENLINLPRNQIIGVDNHQFLHPASINKSECPICLAVKEHRSLKNVRLTDKDKSITSLYSVSLIGDSKVFGMIQVSRDISEELESNEKILSQNAILSSVLNGTPDFIFYKDYLYKNGAYLGCNNAFELFVGKPKEQIIGRTDIELFGAEVGGGFQAYDREVLREKQTKINEEWVTYPNGQRVLLNTSKSPLYDSQGQILGVLGMARDISQYTQLQSEIQDQKQTLEYNNYYDLLTSLPNRTLFSDRIDHAIKLSQRISRGVAVILIDIDHFKAINDSLGHHIGDQVIKKVALRLQQIVMETDTVARFMGDEFSILLSELANTNVVVDIIEKLQQAMKQSIDVLEHRLYCTVSLGIALYPRDGENAEALLKNADAAMHKAKNEGRDTYRYYTQEMTEKAFARIVMESSLRNAIKNDEFVVYYQPQVDARTGKLMGMEALIRWLHPQMGMVEPAKFIPLAEETGFIVELDRWVMSHAMRQMVLWHGMGLNPGVLALNLAMKQLQEKDFIDVLSNTLKESGCAAHCLAFEVTEGQIMENPENAILILQNISAMGIELAIDDFGTGYSSLSYLKRLPINKLKIDQSFIRGLPEDEDDAALTKAIISLAKNLHLSVIAEGVETIEQVNFLIDHGCCNIQGYYYAKPLSCAEMTAYLK